MLALFAFSSYEQTHHHSILMQLTLARAGCRKKPMNIACICGAHRLQTDSYPVGDYMEKSSFSLHFLMAGQCCCEILEYFVPSMGVPSKSLLLRDAHPLWLNHFPSCTPLQQVLVSSGFHFGLGRWVWLWFRQ